MGNNDLSFEKFQKNLQKLTLNEKYRKEKHDSSRIIYNREISPVQMYQNLMDNTVFTYANRVPEEGSKIITSLKGIKRKRIVGSIIQWIGVLLIALFVFYTFNFKSIEWDDNIKLGIALAMFVGIPVFLLTGAFIRASGRKFMADYLEVWNKLKAPIEINCLKNGQLAIIKYRHRDKSCGSYVCALNPDDTIWFGTVFTCNRVPTYVEYMYIIDRIESCTRTENGLMIESSGRCYGKRWVRTRHNKNSKTMCHVFAETQISYRKDEIPSIFSNEEQLEAALMNYGYFEPDRNVFSPL